MSRFFFWLLILGVVTFFIYLGAIRVAFEKLGVSGSMVSLLVFASIAGSLINLPLFKIERRRPAHPPERSFSPPDEQISLTQSIILGINLGGGVIPLMFSLYLILQQDLFVFQTLWAIALISGISYLFSFTIPGLGVGMPIFIAPICAALFALVLNPEQAPALAYVSGTLGVLIGADLLRLKEIRRMPVNVAFIGGAGTFDGVFVTGIIAVLLT